MKSLLLVTIIQATARLAEAAQAGCPFIKPSIECCRALSDAGLGDRVVQAGDEMYASRIASYWSVSAALEPWCMVLPTSTQQVSVAIGTLARHNCPFGIRSGGHGAWKLSNSVSEGVTIDLGHLNGTSYRADTKIASVQPGSSWQAVYETLTPHRVTVPGGRAGPVGVGGFIAGGGNSFYSGSHGFACDNVAEFEAVLGNGSVVHASARQNSDLWTALKGSSANLAVITRYDMYAIDFAGPATDTYGGLVAYDVTRSDDVIDAFVHFADNVAKDQNSSSIVWWAYAAGAMSLSVALENTKNVVDPPAFDRFLHASGIKSTSLRSAPLVNITAELGAGQPAGFRNIWFTGSYSNDARVLAFAAKKHEETVKRLERVLPANSTFNTLCMFQPLPGILVQHSVERGGNVLGLEQRVARGGNGVMMLLTVALDSAQAELTARPLMRALQDSVDAYATSLGLNWDWRYLNYADWTQNPIASYGPEAVAKIKAAAAKYDPDRVLQMLRPSGHKI